MAYGYLTLDVDLESTWQEITAMGKMESQVASGLLLCQVIRELQRIRALLEKEKSDGHDH